VRHVAHAGGRRGTERLAPGARVRHAHRDLERRRAVADIVEERREMACEVVERAASRDDVDEPEQRRSQLRVVEARSIALRSSASIGRRSGDGNAAARSRPTSRREASNACSSTAIAR